jgi:hypothetical protein
MVEPILNTLTWVIKFQHLNFEVDTFKSSNRQDIFSLLISFFSCSTGVGGLNSGLHVCKTGALPLHLQPFSLVILEAGSHFLPSLA